MDLHSDSAENEFDAILAEINKEIGVGDLIGELGCGFTADAEQCKEILSSFAPLGEATISRILSNVARTCADLEDNHTTFSTFSLALGCCIPSELPASRSWNVDILVETIKQLAPGTSWRKVIENLDHDGFDIPNMESFLFFMRLYKTACKEPFPLDAVCASVWKNMEGQLSFLKHAISAPPEVFTFIHSPRKLTAYNLIQREVVSAILPVIMTNSQDSGFILNLWHQNAELVLWGCYQLGSLVAWPSDKLLYM